MDEGFIYERLKALSGGIGREQYRDISKAFMEVVRYNQRALEELKGQIARELRDVSERFYLYGAVTSINDAPIVNDFLFPISEEPSSGSIATIFCQCSRTEMKEVFTGEHKLLLETEDGVIEASARIRPCRRFDKEIEQLKKVFYENGICWRAPYLPYVHRFGDVYCEEFDSRQEIRSVRFKDLDFPVKHDLIPLWNVAPIRLKCTVFPIPAVDEQNFRHTLRLPFPQDGYVAMAEQGIKNIYMSPDGLEIITEEKNQKEFELYRIAVKREIHVPHYSLTSNYRPMRHIDRQADNAAVRLFTMAEIYRIVSSYEAAAGLELRAVSEDVCGEIKAGEGRYQFETPGKRAFCLKFYKEEPDFLTEDLIGFLLEEVQSCFPQLLITGEWESQKRQRADQALMSSK